MYQVIKMYGDVEPWWFMDDWKKDIIQVKEFENYYDALRYYKEEWQTLSQSLPSFVSKSSIMTAFWDKTEQRWCEECAEDLQQYHSLALLTDWQEIPLEDHRPGYERRNDRTHRPTCSLK